MMRQSSLAVFFLISIAILYGYSGTSAAQSNQIDGAIELILTAHPENSLMVNAKVVTESETRVAIRINSASTDRRVTQYTPWDTEHDITLVGLRADTTYRFTALLTLESGETAQSSRVAFKTGSLPDGTPPVEVVTHNELSEGGVTIFAASGDTDNTFWGFDEQGVVVWYLHGNVPLTGSPVMRNLHDGRLMLLLEREVRIISLAGDLLESFELPAYHHDALLLDNGNLLVLTNSTETIDGQLLQGDVILEIDSQGNTVWEWSAFDHLDTQRFPGELARRVLTGGALDWTHSNALNYSSADNTILLSSRSQSWVVNIDHQSGDVQWVMGRDSGVSERFSEKLFSLQNGSWMASQHAAMLTSGGEILIYDNRNEAELSGEIYNSRAVKYLLDTEEMTAQQTWEFIAPKYTQSLGDVDELAGGNILLCAGGPSSAASGIDRNAHIVEVTVGGEAETAWELIVSDTTVYRAERVTWSELSGINF
ncbi:aryl-sulfate sulfotransferase [Microbulbifer sp. OS29]|uniref:Aryl-sulfate sulfotransferase n=1 Tax=Microbulbifer okhotskensis TaxID=2926617 RepID=A0A9X2ENY0_9GAMM|nr:aryl-sulfate sulfotransferase [Microbulbifer okhotskensis]MCO1335737.1 aryl-sulfate sulfotransferase [Microbulbifer okhotskensis]